MLNTTSPSRAMMPRTGPGMLRLRTDAERRRRRGREPAFDLPAAIQPQEQAEHQHYEETAESHDFQFAQLLDQLLLAELPVGGETAGERVGPLVEGVGVRHFLMREVQRRFDRVGDGQRHAGDEGEPHEHAPPAEQQSQPNDEAEIDADAQFEEREGRADRVAVLEHEPQPHHALERTAIEREDDGRHKERGHRVVVPHARAEATVRQDPGQQSGG